MANYVNVSRDEMEKYLLPKGFQLLYLNNVRELTYGKVFRNADRVVSMRVYTGINPDGNSRTVGKDAIRVYLFWKDTDGEIYEVGGSKRVHRVKGWRENLAARINHWEEMLGPACPKCGAPMVLRTVKSGAHKGNEFFSCCMYFKTGCKSTQAA